MSNRRLVHRREGQSRLLRLRPKGAAEARAVHAIGKAQGFSLAQSVKAAGSADLYAAIIKANATTKWTGEVPEVSLGPSSTGSESGHHPTERPGKVTL
jgi:hypothetical protein